MKKDFKKKCYVYVGQYFSNNLGYTENIMPHYLKKYFDYVYVLVHNRNVDSDTQFYDSVWKKFLGKKNTTVGVKKIGKIIYIVVPTKIISNYRFSFSIYFLLKRIKPDVIQFNQVVSLDLFLFFFLDFFSFKKNKLSNICKIFTETHQHASIAKKLHQLSFFNRLQFMLTRSIPCKLSHRLVSKVISISKDCTEVAKKLYGIPSEKIVEIPLGCDCDLFNNPKEDKSYFLQKLIGIEFLKEARDINKYKLIVYSGKLSYSKGFNILLDAFEKIRLKNPNYTLVLLGDGELGDRAKNTPGTILLGYIEHCHLPYLYSSSSICVWPAQESMSMIDAAATGAKVLVSEKMGDKKRLGERVQTFEHNNSFDLAKRIIELIEMPDDQLQIKKQKIRIKRNFCWSNIVKSRVKLYLEGIP